MTNWPAKVTLNCAAKIIQILLLKKLTAFSLSDIKGIFMLDFVPGLMTSFLSICSNETEFYKPKYTLPLAGLQAFTAYATMPGRLEHSSISFCSTPLIQINVELKSSLRGDLNSRTVSHKSSALTT